MDGERPSGDHGGGISGRLRGAQRPDTDHGEVALRRSGGVELNAEASVKRATGLPATSHLKETTMANTNPPANDMERNVRSVTGSAAEKVADKAANLAEKASQQFDSVLTTAEGAARSVAEQGREASERVGAVAGNLKTAVNKSVKEQPMATLAVAAAMGFVVGALWKS